MNPMQVIIIISSLYTSTAERGLLHKIQIKIQKSEAGSSSTGFGFRHPFTDSVQRLSNQGTKPIAQFNLLVATPNLELSKLWNPIRSAWIEMRRISGLF